MFPVLIVATQLAGYSLVPESPRWLVQNGHNTEALVSLACNDMAASKSHCCVRISLYLFLSARRCCAPRGMQPMTALQSWKTSRYCSLALLLVAAPFRLTTAAECPQRRARREAQASGGTWTDLFGNSKAMIVGMGLMIFQPYRTATHSYTLLRACLALAADHVSCLAFALGEHL